MNEQASEAAAPLHRHSPLQEGDRIDVSILVPVLNEKEFIGETVPAMLAQRFDGRLEFLFLDGGSEDGTRAILDELAREDTRVRVLHNPGRRTPHALNLGLRAAYGEFIARMDAHSWYPPDYVRHGVERLRRGDVDWVAGPAIPRAVGKWARRIALALQSPLGQGGSSKWASGSEGHEDASDQGEEIELDTGVFAGVWRRSTLERYGGWDEGWPVNQDAELAARMLGEGGRIVCLRALGGLYAPRDTLGALARQYWRFGYYRVKTVHRHPHALRRSHLVAVALPLVLVMSALGRTPAAWAARRSLAAYVLVLLAVSARAGRRAGAADAVALPIVFATMHFAWGFGFLAACMRMGPPLAALTRVAMPFRRERGRAAATLGR